VANDHLALLNLIWASSGHTGTANRLASFDADGNASYTDPAAYNLNATLTAKGSIYAASAASTPAELAVGTNGEVLVAASGETTGLKWATLPTKDLILQPTAMAPLETAAPGWEVVDFGTIVATVAAFDDTTEEYQNFKSAIPAEINTAGTVTFEVHCTPKTGAASKNVGWTVGHRAVANGETIDGAYTEEDSGAKAIDATTGDESIHQWTETVSNLGWAAGDTVYFRLSRDPSVADDLTGDCYLLLFRVLIPVVL
jgi:hypothetical protein